MQLHSVNIYWVLTMYKAVSKNKIMPFGHLVIVFVKLDEIVWDMAQW